MTETEILDCARRFLVGYCGNRVREEDIQVSLLTGDYQQYTFYEMNSADYYLVNFLCGDKSMTVQSDEIIGVSRADGHVLYFGRCGD